MLHSTKARPMIIPLRIQHIYHRMVDRLFAALPMPLPSLEQVRGCRIVSHRGEHDNRHVLENTVAAFDAACAAGVWGIECDVRWTRDLQPVVSHDRDCLRSFGTRVVLGDITLSELRSRFPLIPSLQEVIQRYSKQVHLMVEFKEEHYPNPRNQNQLLSELFAGLEPQRDYHLLSLNPSMFRFLDFAPPRALLPVAEMNVRHLSRLAIDRGYAGIAGHYLLVSRARIRRHQRLGQKVGTGFVASRNCLYREIQRGVDWIFSECAARLQKICDDLIAILDR
jgi:glycerophosphoryl diester phosphodiesterase